jgi:hypothetical protein
MSEEQNVDQPSGVNNPSRFPVDYIKSNFFRVIHADGVWGGPTLQGNIQACFFSERAPIPRRVVYRVSEDATVGDEIIEERVSRDSMVREVEVEVVLSLQTAKILRDWCRRDDD